MWSSLLTLAALAVAPTALAHMEMTNPPPFRSKSNPHTTDPDYSMTSPLSASGSDYPCKGYQSLYDTPQGASVASWPQGSSQKVTISGGAPHGGGSCQVMLSYDKAASFKVIHTWIGGCPIDKGDWDFTVPSDAPEGDAIFAWTWFNNLGNREMYMNCAHIQITAGSGGSASTSFNSRPAPFEANIGNGCTTVDSRDVMIPKPGPDVTVSNAQAVAPVGSCGSSGSTGSSDGSSSSGLHSSSSESSAPSSSGKATDTSAASSAGMSTGHAYIASSATESATPTGGNGNSTETQPAPAPTKTGGKTCVRRRKRHLGRAAPANHHRRSRSPRF